jgi:hypothetical protein
MRNKPRLGASRTHSRYPTESVVAPEDARIHVGALSFPVEQGNDAEMAISDSRGWSRDAYVYKWHAGDEDRMPPPEALIRMAQRDRRTGTYSALLTVVCDGNHDCRLSGSDWMTETLDRLEWRVDVIPCGQTFEYAGPMPE